MNKMRQSVILGRRRFFGSMLGLTGSLIFRPFRFSHVDLSAEQPEFVIINGWVLTREDVAAREVTPDVV